MIRLLDGMPEGVLGFDASGKDYIQVLLRGRPDPRISQ